MKDGRPMAAGKKASTGAAARLDVLAAAGLPRQVLDAHWAAMRSGRDDVLDACAAAWTARRIHQGTAGRLPHMPERDAYDLDMAIWF